ncbi:unnamed protein product [Didymodactylos carnosus]|uniref:TRPM SLOG domain-containing protein n=1 Tax=Didymodactylos carnosus TaxID=1234261 RepID=A0A814NXA6_9BILA|nr:unnamed protein product [Didymodactylos carnosus]CAF1435618.1 unnamed protein product [Didymodactylos carnosus]CAF3864433.1 unnamed protein product [Didymodactylos carnosus]CAF4232939.1 unnamed protein product [Didymodactylos carnosus]
MSSTIELGDRLLPENNAQGPVLSWNERIRNQEIYSRTCKRYYKNTVEVSPSENEEIQACRCGRLKRSHSLEAIPGERLSNDDNHNDIVQVAVCTYGTLTGLTNDSKFIRCDIDTPAAILYNLIKEDINRQHYETGPRFIITICGGHKYFTMSEPHEKEFMNGILDAASDAGAWILTSGMNNGVVKIIGEGFSQYPLLKQMSDFSKFVLCIGLTKWGCLTEQTRNELKEISSQSSNPSNNQILENFIEDKETLEPHHTHFLLLDDGQLNGYLNDTLRTNFVDEFTKDTTTTNGTQVGDTRKSK